jgi:biopolymer transport protein ExbD
MIRRGGRFAHLRRRNQRGTRVPMESMADIAFLLLIFYMSTAILRPDQGMEIDLPRAAQGMRQPRELVTHVWIDAQGQAMVNDLMVDYDELADVLVRKLRGNPNLIVALNTDRRTRYVYMDRALAELKKAEAVRVSFTTVPQDRGP